MIYIDRIEVVNKLAPYAGISPPVPTSSWNSCDCLHAWCSHSVLLCKTSIFLCVVILMVLSAVALSFMHVSASFLKSHGFAKMKINSRIASPLYIRKVMCAQAVLFLAAEGETICETKYTGQSPRCLPAQLLGKLQRQSLHRSLLPSYLTGCQTQDPHSIFFPAVLLNTKH